VKRFVRYKLGESDRSGGGAGSPQAAPKPGAQS
jgi:hypothetical protein